MWVWLSVIGPFGNTDRLNAFGQADDLALGATLARLIDEPRPSATVDCDPESGCLVPDAETGE